MSSHKYRVSCTFRFVNDSYILAYYGINIELIGKRGKVTQLLSNIGAALTAEPAYRVQVLDISSTHNGHYLDIYESMITSPEAEAATPVTKSKLVVQKKPRFIANEIRNGLQLVVQISTGYKAWVNLQEAQLDGMETAWYDAFKHNYHPEGLTKKPGREEEIEIPF